MAEYTALERTASFGAPYTWTTRGVKYVLDTFQQEYDGAGEPPLVQFSDNMFTMSTNEKATVNQFSKILYGTIQFSQTHVNDLTEDPLMMQIPGTGLTIDHSGLNDYGLSLNTLVDIVDDSDDSSDNSSTSGIGVAYWKPIGKEILILSNEIALAIRTLTASSLSAEPDAQRVKIVGGDVQTALKKLQTLEPLMQHLYDHRHGHASTVTKNLLSFTSEQPGKGVEFVGVDQQRHYDRIIVPTNLKGHLDQALIGEERIYNTNNRWETPGNLLPVPSPEVKLPDGTSERPPTQKSRIWANVKIASIGSAENAKPRAQVKSGTNGTIQAAMPSKYMDPVEANILRKWQQTVDPAADPTMPAEQPIEPELSSDEEEPTTRRVIEDSDSDSEVVTQAPPTQRTLTASDDDDDGDDGEYSRPADSHRQNLFNQTDEIRHRRALRPKVNNIAMQDLSGKGLDKTVQAGSFYANTPRELEKLEEDTPVWQSQRTLQGQRSSVRPRRAFGYDGATDDEPEPVRNEPSEPAVTGPQPLTASRRFDPAAYGLQERQSSTQGRGTTRSSNTSAVSDCRATPSREQRPPRPSQSHVNHLSSVSVDPVPTWPGLVNSRAPVFTKWGPNQNADQLVQYGEEHNSQLKGPLKPPPGLSKRNPTPSDRKYQHLLDRPLDEIQRPALRPMTEEPAYSSEGTSFLTSSSSGGTRSFRTTYVPQTRIHRADLGQMNGDVLRNLTKARSLNDKPRNSRLSTQTEERIEEEDEISTRKYYNTMNLQAPNKGKKTGKQGGNSKNSQISKAQQALKAEFLPVQPPSQPQPAKKKQAGPLPAKTGCSQAPSRNTLDAARTNPTLATLHKDAILEDELSELTLNFMNDLLPALNASRAFAGRLEFEMQIGQLVIQPSSRISQRKVYEWDNWNSAFNSNRVAVQFTNILTNHGLDVDGILEAKTTRTLQTWSPDNPGPSHAIIEFTCHDNTGQHFVLLVKEDGSYVVTSNPLVISKIGIHCPGRIWDTCAVLSGSSTWQTSSLDLEDDIKEFISTLFVKAGTLTMIYFRPPTSNRFAVTSVHYKRTSLHDCQNEGAEGLQLKVTEVKTLTIHSHRDDKKLLVAFEKAAPNKDSGAFDLHYEVAVIDEQLHAAFEGNETISFGDRLDKSADLTVDRTRILLGTALRLVDRIDWVGRLNYGSLVQLQDVKIERNARLGTTLPPNTRVSTMRPVPNQPGQGTSARTSISNSVYGAPSARTVLANTTLPGVRANQPATLYRDDSGNMFYYGSGGAKVPYIEHGNMVSSAEIHPGDSASQYGGPRRGLPRNVLFDDKPAGFW